LPALFVRVETIPTTALRRARAAVKLKLAQLSPAPLSEVEWDLAPLGEPQAGPTRWAIGFVRRAELARASSERLVEIEWPVEGQSISFRFSNRAIVHRRLPGWIAGAPAVAVFLLVLTLLLAAIDLRLRQSTMVANEQGAVTRQIADARNRTLRERQTVVADWRAAEKAPIPSMLRCALDAAGRAWPGRRQVASLEARPGNITFAFVGRPADPAGLKESPGIKIVADGASGQARTILRVEETACRGGS
jgi:hypothetical protein